MGDVGIHQKVPEDFWQKANDLMLDHFKKNEYVQGLSAGIRLAGQQLASYFPYQLNDTNELSDEISFGD